MVWVAVISFWKIISESRGVQKVRTAYVVTAILGVLVTVNSIGLLDVLLIRFQNTGSEDFGSYLRMLQYKAVWREIIEHPFIGIGIGGYASGLVLNRFDPQVWMYEGQVAALVMQFGIIGFIALIITTCRITFSQKGKLILNAGWLLIGVGWILASLTNPYLLSSLSGLMFWLVKNNINTLQSDPI